MIVFICFIAMVSVGISEYCSKTNYLQSQVPVKKPNVILLLADDLGWTDVGFHVSNINTPTLTKLAHEGTIFENMYSQPICTPSRAALFTGKYPFRLGLQGAIANGAPAALPLGELTLAELFKQAQYKTSLIGKWHLGFTTNKHTPVERGFDHFYGFYGGAQSYFTHSTSSKYGAVGYDFVREERDAAGNITRETMWSANNTYSTHLHTKEAVNIIKKHNTQSPLFLVMSYQAPHSPLDVQSEDMEMYNKSIGNTKRRQYAGLVNSIDKSVAVINDTLGKRGMTNDTIWIFMSDNGGSTSIEGNRDTAACNYPWRSGKGSVYEGGIKVPAFISGHGIPRGKKVNGLFHFVDWLPTLAKLISIDIHQRLDGIDQTDLIMRNVEKRDGFIINIDPIFKIAAVRKGQWKLALGYPSINQLDSWYPPLIYDQNGHVSKNEFGQSWIRISKMISDYKAGSCRDVKCYSDLGARLYNLKTNPYEVRNEAKYNSKIVEELTNELVHNLQNMSDPQNALNVDQNAIPNSTIVDGCSRMGVWKPWK